MIRKRSSALPKFMDVKVSVVGANSSEASGTHNRQFTLPLQDGKERIIPGLSRMFRDSWQLG